MSLPRTLPVALIAGTLMYLPAIALRTLLTGPTSVSAMLHLPAFFARASGYLLLGTIALFAMAVTARKTGWAQFGFRRSEGGWGVHAGAAAAVGIALSIALKIVSGSGLDATLAGTPPALIATMIIVATLVEELFVRGWMLGFLGVDAEAVADAKRSVGRSVLTGAAFFSAMHLTLARSGIDIPTLVTILVFTTLLGVLCGLARVRSRSLVGAIATHFAGNVGGVLGGILYAVIFGLPTVH